MPFVKANQLIKGAVKWPWGSLLVSFFLVYFCCASIYVLAVFCLFYFSFVLYFIVFIFLFWKLTGDLAFASGSVSLLVEQCGVLGAKNLSILVNGSDEGNPAAEAFVEQVAELLCPNDCTLNGKCINGSCVCYKDYTASDCSMSIHQKPEIYR